MTQLPGGSAQASGPPTPATVTVGNVASQGEASGSSDLQTTSQAIEVTPTLLGFGGIVKRPRPAQGAPNNHAS